MFKQRKVKTVAAMSTAGGTTKAAAALREQFAWQLGRVRVMGKGIHKASI